MREAPAERTKAEQVLQDEGWTLVRMIKDSNSNNDVWHYHDMMKWCEHTLGPGRTEPGHNWLDELDVWYTFSWYGYYNFHFKHSVDATMFILRWA